VDAPNIFAKAVLTGARQKGLEKEAFKLYDAISFAMYKYGRAMNAHVTLTWRMMGVGTHSRAAYLLSAFNKEASRWLAVGTRDKPRLRTKRAWPGSAPYMYVNVHENGRDQGFQTHQLCYIPPDKGDLLNEWALTWFAPLLKKSGVGAQAICVRVDKSRNERDAVALCWDRYRYVTKTLFPHYKFYVWNERWLNARSIIKPYPFIETEPVHCPQIASGARDIWSNAQREAEFCSRLGTGDYDRLCDGWELKGRWES
jgi:hypothetical protein